MFRIYHDIRPDGTNIYIDTAAIYQYCVQHRTANCRMEIEYDQAIHLHEVNCIDRPRIIELYLRIMSGDTKVFDMPLIGGSFIDGSQPMLIDGRHRYTLAAVGGIPFLPCIMLSERVWRRFEVWGPKMTREQLREIPVNPRRY